MRIRYVRANAVTEAAQAGRRGAAGVVLLLSAALTACSGGGSSAPAPTRTATKDTCAWTAAAFSAPGRAVMITDDTSAYLLVDVSTGRIVDRCRPEADGVSGRYAAVDQRPSLNGRRDVTQGQDDLTAHWWGGARPGGPDHRVIATADGTLDLATGARTTVRVPGFTPAAVGGTSVVMARTGRSEDAQPIRPQDWCLAPITGGGACSPVPGASGSGSPVVTDDGTVHWLGNALSATALRVTFPRSTPAPLFLRTARGLVTAVAAAPDVPTDPPVSQTVGAGPDGHAFVALPAASRIVDAASRGTITWYSVTPTGPVAHTSTTSWADLLRVGAGGQVDVDDVAVSPDGQTLYVVVTPLNAASPGTMLVAVPRQGAYRVVFDTTKAHGNDPDYVSGAHFLTVPASVTAT